MTPIEQKKMHRLADRVTRLTAELFQARSDFQKLKKMQDTRPEHTFYTNYLEAENLSLNESLDRLNASVKKVLDDHKRVTALLNSFDVVTPNQKF